MYLCDELSELVLGGKLLKCVEQCVPARMAVIRGNSFSEVTANIITVLVFNT
jgi:hypothetical protein